VAKEREFGGMARKANNLYTVTCSHKHGWLYPWARGSSPFQSTYSSYYWKGHPHRLWRLLRGCVSDMRVIPTSLPRAHLKTYRMNREKYPEKVPFRLTRMLTKAMEVRHLAIKYTCTDPNIPCRLAELMAKAPIVTPALSRWRYCEETRTLCLLY
jgi:hypothetical protein